MKAFLAVQKISNSRRRSFVASLTSLLLLASLSLVVSAPVALSANPPRKILSGWIPYYGMKTSLPAALNNSDLIREVMPFWYTLKYNANNKKSSITDLYSPANPSVPIKQPLDAMRSAGYLIIPTITDGTDKLVLSNLLADPKSRTSIAILISNFVKVNNYDGIDLDFEGFAFVDGNTTWAKTQISWVAFIKELSALMRADKKILSIATPYAFNPSEKQKGYTVYAWAKVAEYIDRLRIMTYDYSVARPGPIGPIAWAEKTIQYAVSIMPASKVYVGLPGYGRDWVTKVTGVCPAVFSKVIKSGAKAATFVMRDAATLAASYGVTPQYDTKTAEVTFSYTKQYDGLNSAGQSTICTANRTAWYQNAESYAARTALVGKYKLGGVVAWTLGMEEPGAMESIRLVASSIAPATVLSVISADATEINYGKAIKVIAQFSLEDKSPVAGVPIEVEAKSPSESEWRTLPPLLTAIDGSAILPILIGKTTTLRFSSEGTWERAPSISNELVIEVSRTLSLTAPSSVKNGKPFSISGVVLPRTSGVSVALLRLVAGKWNKVGSSLPTDDQGAFAFTIDKEARGIVRYNLIIEGDTTWKTLSSPTFSIIIR
jgi:spore germination protein YaaH